MYLLQRLNFENDAFQSQVSQITIRFPEFMNDEQIPTKRNVEKIPRAAVAADCRQLDVMALADNAVICYRTRFICETLEVDTFGSLAWLLSQM